MAADSANSAWHPALMPNRDDHAPAPSEPSATESQEPPTDADATNPAEHVADPGADAVDAWFSKDGHDDDGGAWLDNEELKAASAESNPTDPDTVPSDAPKSEDPASSVPVTQAQHASSMSFARTAHEVSFDGDDDGDWSFPKTEADPFKFMAPSNRTNSFPVVPLQDQPDVDGNGPLPSSQALDVVEEADRDYAAEEREYDEPAAPSQQEVGRRRHAPSASMGGDVNFANEAIESRFEEGVPLIENEKAGGRDPFAEDGDGDDDFFSQVQGSGAPETDAPVPHLERKSTMQAMGDFGGKGISRQSTFAETLEEEDETQVASTTETTQVQSQDPTQPANEDISTKWQDAFGDDDADDNFLAETDDDNKAAVDASGFLGSDDEGLLDDDDELLPDDDETSPTTQSAPAQPVRSNPYAPQAAPSPAMPSPGTQPNHYAPATTAPNPYQAAQFGSPALPQFGVPAPPRPVPSQTQSFADKAKGGYSSPYDLPTDLISTQVKPRKRPSMQQMATQAASQPPAIAPPRSSSAVTPAVQPPTSGSRPPSSHGAPPAGVAAKSSTPNLRKSASGFFEDLPMTNKPRPASRHSNRVPSPHVGQGPPTPQGPPRPAYEMAPTSESQGPPSTIQPPISQPNPATGLVAPERVSPYAALPNAAPPTGHSASRYSPAPAQQAGAGAAPTVNNRYSAAPASLPRRSSNSYSPTQHPPSSVLAHQPRTSSPLAHFETKQATANGEALMSDRRTSSAYEPRMNRVPSLPPTREVAEEDDKGLPRSVSAAQLPPPSDSRYAVAPPAGATRMTPPPMGGSRSPLSPPKRSNSYVPQEANAQPAPSRPQTQSPDATRDARMAGAAEMHRPSSSHSPTATFAKPASSMYMSGSRSRMDAHNMEMVPPTDGREHDPLERWKGAPVVTWGMGGTMVASFPKSNPRYGMSQTTPTIIRSPGEVKVMNIKDVDPLQEQLSRFPGPLRGKSKKKETVAWLISGIEALQKELPDVSFHTQLSVEAKRAIERLALWRILRVFVENDGVLEGNAGVNAAVRDILAPDSRPSLPADDPALSAGLPMSANPTSVQGDGIDSATVEQIKRCLMKGDRETAVWTAVDKRLWGHAMLISHTVSAELYKQVSQEFVRKEVNYPGNSNESIAALYKVLSGNFDDCVDELVPAHARAGFQLVSTATTQGPSKGAMDGLDNCRETLMLILSNRSNDDIRGIKALGDLLANYGRAEAAHICYMFSRSVSVFAGLDDPLASFVLLGSDHRQQADRFAKETEALQLSEVYEYGLTLAPGLNASAGAPHLAAYKLQHAITLAEYGFRDKALQYCDAITAAMTSQTRRSPYHHAVLVAAVDDFMRRLKQAPKGEASSWMSKPSMNKVSDSMWNRFNKFVAGDDEAGPNGTPGAEGAENGPFARIAGTPTLSRSPSMNNLEQVGYGGGSPVYPGQTIPPPQAMSTKYAPVSSAPSASHNPYEPPSHLAASPAVGPGPMDYLSRSNDSGYAGAGLGLTQNGGFQPKIRTASGSSSLPGEAGHGVPLVGSHPSPMLQPTGGGYQPHSLQEPADLRPYSSGGVALGEAPSETFQPSSFDYQPPTTGGISQLVNQESQESQEVTGGFEPPSMQPYGYEPPSYAPPAETSPEDGDEAPKPKPKSFMDDDDDDIPGLRPAPAMKSKAERDKEAQEIMRKAAEEDAQRAAAQQGEKKGWFGSWFKRADSPNPGAASPNKAVRAKLGEANSFVYDPELKRWINKKPGAEQVEAKTATPPPPKGLGPRSVSGTPPPPTATPPPPMARLNGPPTLSAPRSVPNLNKVPSEESLAGSAPGMTRSVSNMSATGPPSAPPSRPTTSMSNASSIDDLIGAAGAAPRRPGQKKPRKSGRYVDVMAK